MHRGECKKKLSLRTVSYPVPWDGPRAMDSGRREAREGAEKPGPLYSSSRGLAHNLEGLKMLRSAKGTETPFD